MFIPRDITHQTSGLVNGSRTTGCLDFEDALLGSAVLEGVGQGSLDREERPLGICGRAGSRRFSANNSIVAALDGGAVYGKVERRHREAGIVGVVMDREEGGRRQEWMERDCVPGAPLASDAG